MLHERNCEINPIHCWGPEPNESDVKVDPGRAEGLQVQLLLTGHCSPGTCCHSAQVHLNLTPTPKNNTAKEPEAHERICSMSCPLSTAHPCNNLAQPGALSNELSPRMLIEKQGGIQKGRTVTI